MTINSFRAFLFTAAGATAAVGTAYVSGALDPYLTAGRAAVGSPSAPASPKSERLGQQQAAVEPGNAPQQQTVAPDKASKPASEAKPAATAEPKPAPTAALPVVVAPSFDIVRVEPDGSIVVAGKAAPEAMVEIVAGANVLGKTKAGAEGDFAIALDEQLKPGGHELVLRSTAKDNVVATSPETAVVSIPEEKDGQVLALVEKPGEPSKLITVPKPEPVQKTASQTENAPAASDGNPAASGTTADTKQTVSPVQPAAPAAPEKPAAAKAEPATAGQLAGQPAAAGQSQTAAGPKIAVDAVEIEGRKVFVAGAADPGRKVRVYANDTLLGESPASPGGRFLVEAERELPVGDYIIRADVLEPNSDKVVARAAVPFEREPGNAVSAVAPEASKAANAGTQVQPANPAASKAAGAGIQAQPAPARTAVASSDSAAKAPEPKAAEPSPAAVAPATAAMPSTATAGQGGTSAPASETAPAPEGRVAAVTPDASVTPGTATAAAAPASAAPAAAAKLESVNGSVIIRRGDTLWRISRRVYGRGVRYSTIYLANQDQITDPDRIWPGQIFNVPGKSSEGEPADMSAVKDQAAKGASKEQQ
jgi:nucleoid-associated protein YgaU